MIRQVVKNHGDSIGNQDTLCRKSLAGSRKGIREKLRVSGNLQKKESPVPEFTGWGFPGNLGLGYVTQHFVKRVRADSNKRVSISSDLALE